MPYEHPLIFGAREYFWDDATFHDDCIGILIDETDCDDLISDQTTETPAPVKRIHDPGSARPRRPTDRLAAGCGEEIFWA